MRVISHKIVTEDVSRHFAHAPSKSSNFHKCERNSVGMIPQLTPLGPLQALVQFPPGKDPSFSPPQAFEWICFWYHHLFRRADHGIFRSLDMLSLKRPRNSLRFCHETWLVLVLGDRTRMVLCNSSGCLGDMIISPLFAWRQWKMLDTPCSKKTSRKLITHSIPP